jgi:hypothetical protein
MALEHISNELLLRVLLLQPAVLASAEGSQQGHAGRPQLTHLEAVLQDALHEGRPLRRVLHKQGGIFGLKKKKFLCTIFNIASSPAPTVSEDAGIEPRTVATIRHWLSDALTPIRLDLIHTRQDLNHTRQDLVHTRQDLNHTRLDLIHTRLDLIHIRRDLIHTRLDLIHTRPDLIHTRLDPIHTRLDLIHARPDLIHKQMGQQQNVLR